MRHDREYSIYHFSVGSHLWHRHKHCVPGLYSRLSVGQCKHLRVPCGQPWKWWRPCRQLLLCPQCSTDEAGCLENKKREMANSCLNCQTSGNDSSLIHTYHLWTSWHPAGRAAELRWKCIARWGRYPPSPMLAGRCCQTGLFAQASRLGGKRGKPRWHSWHRKWEGLAWGERIKAGGLRKKTKSWGSNSKSSVTFRYYMWPGSNQQGSIRKSQWSRGHTGARPLNVSNNLL